MNIIVQLQGGLGNQLFQYATGRAIAERSDGKLLLDQGWFSMSYDNVTPRELLLMDLNVKGDLISPNPPIKRPKKIRRLFQTLAPLDPYIFIEKQPYQFDVRLKKLPRFRNQNLYLIGYWQSYRYFDAIKSVLQSEIQPKTPLDDHYLRYLHDIKDANSAMVHVRRGDYVKLASAAKIHGCLGLEYYQKGMGMLLADNPTTNFFVFSDDLDWAKANLPYQDKICFIESTNKLNAPIQELFLMTQCQKHLIANSSLSWWGAWLSKSHHPQVIAPQNWTLDAEKTWGDLLPQQWQKI